MPSVRILFFTEGIQFHLRQRNEVRAWLTNVARSHKHSIAELNYIFVSDDRLLEMNKQFLNHDTYTDIITFESNCGTKTVCGEIYISIDRILDNAHKFRVTMKDELHRVMAHGLLHLCGFKDKSVKQQAVMRRQEEKALDLRTF